MRLVYRFAMLSAIVIISSFSFATHTTLAAISSGTSTTGDNTANGSSTLSITKPSSTTGDILIADITVYGGTGISITPPSGWVLVQRTDNGTILGVASYRKLVSFSEPSSYTWGISPSARAVGGIVAYSGVIVENPIDVSSGGVGQGTSAQAPAITTTYANEEIVDLFAVNNTRTFSTPSGMTEKFDVTNPDNKGPATAVDDVQKSMAGFVATSTALFSNPSREWVAQQIALRPAGDPRSTDLVKASSQAWYTNFHNNLAGTSAVTGCAWINIDDVPTVNVMYILSLGAEDASFGFFYSDDVNGSGPVLGVSINDIQSLYTWAKDPDVWYHVCATFDGSLSESERVKFYVDGDPIGTMSNNQSSISSSANEEFAIGTRNITREESDSRRYFDGQIDDVRVWTRVLSDSEIQAMYADPSNPSLNGASLGGWWKFDDDATDSSGNGNNLSGINSPTFSVETPY